MNWIGAADMAREYVLVSDAMEIAARIRSRDEAFGNDWILPGSGPLTGAQVAEIAGRHLGRPVKLRTASVFMLRLVSLFHEDLRGFMQVVPDYVKPIAYDASGLEGLIGKAEMTYTRSALRARSTRSWQQRRRGELSRALTGNIGSRGGQMTF